jgi:hypothetical protein
MINEMVDVCSTQKTDDDLLVFVEMVHRMFYSEN